MSIYSIRHYYIHFNNSEAVNIINWNVKAFNALKSAKNMQKLVSNFFEFSQFDLSVSLLRNLIQWFITLFLNTWWLDKYDIILKGETKCHLANVFLTQITMAIHIILVPYKSNQELISPLTLLTSIIQNYTLTPAFTWRKGECTVIGFAQSFYLKSNTSLSQNFEIIFPVPFGYETI